MQIHVAKNKVFSHNYYIRLQMVLLQSQILFIWTAHLKRVDAVIWIINH